MPDTEALAVSEITSVVALSNLLKSEIKTGDKTPSFDGEIRIHPHGKSKKDLELVRVQVKGRIAKNAEELDCDRTSFQADVIDLENYARNGGVMFFCVLVHGTARRAYYNSLLPVKLKNLLKRAAGHSTKAIELVSVPTDVHELEELLINHSRDSAKQFSFWNAELQDADLTNIPPGVCYSARYESIASSEYEAARHLFGKDMYLYMKLSSCPIPIPTNSTVQISSMTKTINKPISVNGVRFYEKYSTLITEHEMQVIIGNITMSYPHEDEAGEAKFTISLFGPFRERLHSLRFAKAMVLNGGYEIGNNHIDFVSEDGLEIFTSGEAGQICSLYEDIAAILDAFNDEGDFEIESISDDDLKTIGMLKRGLIEKQRLRLEDIEYDMAVCSIRFLGRHYLLYRETGEDGLSSIRDYVHFDFDMAMKADEGAPMLRVAKYGFAEPSEYLDVANLRPQALVDACIFVGYNEANCEVSNDIGLALLARYDAAGRIEDFECAKEIFDWLKDSDNEIQSIAYELNALQVRSRSRELTFEDEARVHAIIEEDSSKPPSKRELTAACLAIIGDNKNANSVFRRLNKETRERFDRYPIGNLIHGTAKYVPHDAMVAVD